MWRLFHRHYRRPAGVIRGQARDGQVDGDVTAIVYRCRCGDTHVCHIAGHWSARELFGYLNDPNDKRR